MQTITSIDSLNQSITYHERQRVAALMQGDVRRAIAHRTQAAIGRKSAIVLVRLFNEALTHDRS
jgi:hypothetical protein